MKFAKRSFLVAGIYGLVLLLPQYFMEEKNSRDFPSLTLSIITASLVWRGMASSLSSG